MQRKQNREMIQRFKKIKTKQNTEIKAQNNKKV